MEKSNPTIRTYNSIYAPTTPLQGATLRHKLSDTNYTQSVPRIVNEAMNVLDALENQSPEKPLPLRRLPRSQESYPIDAFGAFAPAVSAFAHGVKVPLAMAGASVLASLSACTQSVANIHMKDGREIPLSLYAFTIAESGERKSSLDKAVLKAIYATEEKWYAKYQQELKIYEQAKTEWEALSKRQRELHPLTQNVPINPSMIVENINTEGATRLLSEGRPSLAFFSDEAGVFLGGQAFQKENVLKSISFFSNLWGGKSIDKIRYGEGFLRLYNRRASMHLMVQPAIAKKVLADELMQGQGFLSRFLISWPQSLAGTRMYSTNDICDSPQVQAFYESCSNFLEMPLRTNKDTGGLIFDALSLDEDAHHLWENYHNTVEAKLTENGELCIVSAFACKTAEQALRIAGVLCLAEHSGAWVVNSEIMNNAVRLAEWYLHEILRLRQGAGVTPEILQAERLLEWMKTCGHRHVSLRFIQRHTIWDTKAKASPIVKILEEHGYLKRGAGSKFIGDSNAKTFWELVE